MATTQELQVKIKVDTSGVQSGVNQAKKSLNGLKGASGATKEVDKSLEGVYEQLDKIRNNTAIENLITGVQALKGNFSDTLGHMTNAFAVLNKKSSLYNDIEWEGPMNALKDSVINMKEAASSAKMELSNMFGGTQSGALNAVAAIALVIAAVVALVAQIKMAIRTAQQIKQINAEAAKIGLSVNAYQQWGYVLESVGVQADELRGLIQTLSDEQAQMAEGSEGASKAFAALGLSMEEVTSMSQEQLFTETITRLQNVTNSVERTKLAYQIFGEDAAHVANVMNMSNEQLTTLINNYNMLGGAASQSLVNKSNELSMSLGNLKQAWAGVTNAIAELFMPAITAVVNWLTKAIAIVRMFIQTIFGLDSTPATKSTSKMATGMGTYKKATEGATKAVEKLKRSTMGFDELNKLPGNDDSGSSSGAADYGASGGGISGGGFELPEVADLGLEKWQEWFDKYKRIIQDVTTWSLIGIGVVGAVMCFMSGNWVGGVACLGLAGIGLAVGFAEGGTFERLGKTIKDIGNNLADWFKKTIAPVFTKAYWVEKWENIKTAVTEKFEQIKQTISQKWQTVKDWFAKNVAPIFTKDYWLNKFEPLRAAASEKLEAAKAAISGKWNEIKEWFAKNVAPKFTKQYWLEKFEQMRKGVSDKLNEIKNNFSSAWTNIKNVFSGWGTFFTGLWDKIKTIFKNVGKTVGDAVSGAIKSAINSIFSSIESKVNSFIRMINGAISIINKIPGVNLSKLSTISIPRLATGGIVTSSTLANIGEAGAEAVLPLERNTGWMDTLADKIAAKQSAPSKIVLEVDGRAFAQASIKSINDLTRATGKLQLQVM